MPSGRLVLMLDGSPARRVKPMIIDLLRQEHRNIEKLLLVLEQELSLFARGERPDYEVIRAVIAYFEVYPDTYHHPQEDIVSKS
jgi:hemerythrin-like domain-containing protein